MELYQFVADAFSDEGELRDLARAVLRNEAIGVLPGKGTPPSQVAEALVDACRTRGLLRELYEQIVRLRPERVDDILKAYSKNPPQQPHTLADDDAWLLGVFLKRSAARRYRERDGVGTSRWPRVRSRILWSLVGATGVGLVLAISLGIGLSAWYFVIPEVYRQPDPSTVADMLAAYDPALFSETFQVVVARALPSRDATTELSSYAAILASSKERFSLLSNSGASFFENGASRVAFIDAKESQLRVQVLARFPPSKGSTDEYLARFELFASTQGRTVEEEALRICVAIRDAGNLRGQLKENARDRLQFRLTREPFMVVGWLSDGPGGTSRAHLTPIFPKGTSELSFSVHRGGEQVSSTFTSFYDKLWGAALDFDDPLVSNSCNSWSSPP